MCTLDTVLKIFNHHRRSSDSFSESNFINELHRGKDIKNSFIGLKKYNSFISSIENEFCIYFTNTDHDKNYNLNQFIERIDQLKSNRKTSLKAIKKAINEPMNVPLLILCLSFCAFSSIAIYQYFKIIYLTIIPFIILLFPVLAVEYYEKTKLQKLYKKVEKAV